MEFRQGACVVPSCKHKQRSNKRMSYHRFPTRKMHVKVRTKWIQVIRDLRFDQNWEPFDGQICSRHFTSADFRTDTPGTKRLLQPFAIPSQNLSIDKIVESGGRMELDDTEEEQISTIFVEGQLQGQESDLPPQKHAGLGFDAGDIEYQQQIPFSAKNICKIFQDLCVQHFPQHFKTNSVTYTEGEYEIANKLFEGFVRLQKGKPLFEESSGTIPTNDSENQEWHQFQFDSYFDESRPEDFLPETTNSDPLDPVLNEVQFEIQNYGTAEDQVLRSLSSYALDRPFQMAIPENSSPSAVPESSVSNSETQTQQCVPLSLLAETFSGTDFISQTIQGLHHAVKKISEKTKPNSRKPDYDYDEEEYY